jgi:hypothetical protein
MKSLLVALLMTPFASGAALAARPLADAQMDGVAAGFSARSVADAEGMAGSGGGFLAPAPVQGVTIEFAPGAVFPSITFNAAGPSRPFDVVGALNALSLQ